MANGLLAQQKQQGELLNFLGSPKARGLGIALLQGSGFSQQPQTLGQSLGRGLQLGNQLQREEDRLALMQDREARLAKLDEAKVRAAIAGDQVALQKRQALEAFSTGLEQGLPAQQLAPLLARAGVPSQALSLLQGPKPTSLQSNLIAAGLVPGSPEYQKAIIEGTTRPGVSVNVGSGVNKADTSKIERLDKKAETSALAIDNIARFRAALDAIGDTNLLAPITLDARRALNAIGIPVDKTKMAAGEVIRSFGTKFMLDFIQQTMGSISERENKLFMEAAPGLGRSREGNIKIANAMEATALRGSQKSDFMRSYLEANGNLNGAENQYTRFINERPVINKDFSINHENITNWQPYLKRGFRDKVPQKGRGVLGVQPQGRGILSMQPQQRAQTPQAQPVQRFRLNAGDL